MNLLRHVMTNTLFHNNVTTNPVKVSVRHFQRRPFIRRFGYKPHIHCRGFLPRVKGDVGPLRTLPNEPLPDEWRKKEALFGQNDYIDLLGDGSVSVTDLMTGTPRWLKNFKGNELQMSVRKKKTYSHWKWLRPKKYHELEARIFFLYKKLNFKRAPPPPQYP
ncbi:39S ribosomal protein L51, mitochondrial-like [Oppia nitens]|uniref:39S ribosomal protein L51, mitochondrial-like n=1 Tax=Oppia nitens TaxID=1686743 RepID=UPI0023DAD5DA|nr:39S ribosomal protein L51, mitochondrial-like [Oppia nitens]